MISLPFVHTFLGKLYKAAARSRVSSLAAMQQERTFEFPVCGVGVTLLYLHEHYKTHFQASNIDETDAHDFPDIPDIPVSPAAIKTSPERGNLVGTQSTTSTELRKERKISNHVETSSGNRCKRDGRCDAVQGSEDANQGEHSRERGKRHVTGKDESRVQPSW